VGRAAAAVDLAPGCGDDELGAATQGPLGGGDDLLHERVVGEEPAAVVLHDARCENGRRIRIPEKRRLGLRRGTMMSVE